MRTLIAFLCGGNFVVGYMTDFHPLTLFTIVLQLAWLAWDATPPNARARERRAQAVAISESECGYKKAIAAAAIQRPARASQLRPDYK